MNLESVKKLNLPTTPGCYQFYNSRSEIIYIGKADVISQDDVECAKNAAENCPTQAISVS